MFDMSAPVHPKSEETRRKLIDAAGEVFAEVGFKSATVRQITDRAEANVAAINYYFGDKVQLYRVVLQTVTETLVHALQQACSSGTAEQQLYQFVRTILLIKSTEAHPWASLLMAREITELQDDLAGFIVDAVRPMHSIAERIVGDLTQATPDQVRLAASMLVTLCVNRIRQQRLEERLAAEYRPTQDEPIESVEPTYCFALAGIRALCGSNQ
jgi:AcrR family transcriptional regulator